MADDTDKLIADLDAEFGKKPRVKLPPGAAAKDRKVGSQRLLSAKEQLEQFQFKNIADWRAYREQLEANELAQEAYANPSWIPEARLTYVVEQYCEICHRTHRYIGGEYVKFRAPQSRAVIIRRAEVVPDLMHYGTMDLQGKVHPLPDLIEYVQQSVKRCPVCIDDERKVEELWDLGINGQEKDESLDIQIEV